MHRGGIWDYWKIHWQLGNRRRWSNQKRIWISSYANEKSGSAATLLKSLSGMLAWKWKSRSKVTVPRWSIDCHHPSFRWITNDCHCIVNIVLQSSMTSHVQNMVPSSFPATLFWPGLQELREKYSDHYCLSMQTTSSQSYDMNWLVFCTNRQN
jgi:hypothetical protein